MCYKVSNHLTSSIALGDDPEWDTVDNIVKQWIYGTLSQSVLQSIITSDATTTETRTTIEALFHENKEVKAIELDDELRNIQLGDSTILEYCNHIKSIADLLSNIGAPVYEKNLVTYAINGLSEKYTHVKPT